MTTESISRPEHPLSLLRSVEECMGYRSATVECPERGVPVVDKQGFITTYKTPAFASVELGHALTARLFAKVASELI